MGTTSKAHLKDSDDHVCEEAHPGQSHSEWHASTIQKNSWSTAINRVSKALKPYVGPRQGLWADPHFRVPHNDELTPRQIGNRVRDDHGHDRGEAANLRLYADNDAQVAGTSEKVNRNLINKMAGGEYQHHRAVHAFEHVTNHASKKAAYDAGQPGHAFSPASRRAVARDMADHYYDEAAQGNYDYLKFKKYQQRPELDATAPQPQEQMPPQGMPPQGMPPQGMPPQGMPPQGMPPQEAQVMKSLENLARSLKKAHSISRVSDLGGRHPKKDIIPDQPQESERVPRRIGERISISSMDVHKPAKVPDAEKKPGKSLVSKNISKVRENMKQGMSPESAVRSAYPGYTAKQIGAFLREHKLEPLMKGLEHLENLERSLGRTVGRAARQVGDWLDDSGEAGRHVTDVGYGIARAGRELTPSRIGSSRLISQAGLRSKEGEQRAQQLRSEQRFGIRPDPASMEGGRGISSRQVDENIGRSPTTKRPYTGYQEALRAQVEGPESQPGGAPMLSTPTGQIREYAPGVPEGATPRASWAQTRSNVQQERVQGLRSPVGVIRRKPSGVSKGVNSWNSALDKLIGKHSQIDTRNGRERFQAQHGIPTQVHKSISDDDVNAKIAKSRHMHRTNGFRWHESEHLK